MKRCNDSFPNKSLPNLKPSGVQVKFLPTLYQPSTNELDLGGANSLLGGVYCCALKKNLLVCYPWFSHARLFSLEELATCP